MTMEDRDAAYWGVIPGAPSFKWSEFAVSGSFPSLVKPVPPKFRDNVERLAYKLQRIRNHVARPVRILSGYRPPELNLAVGGSETSQHMRAEAADITFDGLRETFLDLVDGHLRVGAGQCILYPSRSFIHIALPSTRYPTPSFHIHEPRVGLHYRKVNGRDHAEKLLEGL